jgi:hypothetical protein
MKTGPGRLTLPHAGSCRIACTKGLTVSISNRISSAKRPTINHACYRQESARRRTNGRLNPHPVHHLNTNTAQMAQPHQIYQVLRKSHTKIRSYGVSLMPQRDMDVSGSPNADKPSSSVRPAFTPHQRICCYNYNTGPTVIASM